MPKNKVLNIDNIKKGDTLKLYIRDNAKDIRIYKVRGRVDNVLVAMYYRKTQDNWVYVLLTSDWLESYEKQLVLLKGELI